MLSGESASGQATPAPQPAPAPPPQQVSNTTGVVLDTAVATGTPLTNWPPVLDDKNVTTQSVDGRKIERFIHGDNPAWGYGPEAAAEWGYPKDQETGAAQQNHNSFYVVSPKVPRDNAPLCVVLHSANRTAYDYLGFEALNRKTENGDDPATAMTNSPDNFYALYLNSTNAEWWGWSQAHRSPNFKNHVNAPGAGELRVLDTIEWVVQRYKIDRNRIYLCGVSMGGCGTLGIGMAHGEVFAAIKACVPAGTAYASYRRGGFGPVPDVTAPEEERAAWLQRAAGVGLVDPPVILDFSSIPDTWSNTQPALVMAAQAGRLPLILNWGLYAHVTFGSLIAKYPICQVALAFPWLEIRKNEAYAVFTHASCDQRPPWLNAEVNYDGNGQMNAFCRWKNVQDTPNGITMQLWIEHPAIQATGVGMPATATADVTLRRLQQFKIDPAKTYAWQITSNGQPVASGKLAPDATKLLTIPQVKLATTPVELSIKPAE